jgi:hypothetical protein
MSPIEQISTLALDYCGQWGQHCAGSELRQCRDSRSHHSTTRMVVEDFPRRTAKERLQPRGGVLARKLCGHEAGHVCDLRRKSEERCVGPGTTHHKSFNSPSGSVESNRGSSGLRWRRGLIDCPWESCFRQHSRQNEYRTGAIGLYGSTTVLYPQAGGR